MGNGETTEIVVMRDNILRRDCLARILASELNAVVHGAESADAIASLALACPSLIIFDIGEKSLMGSAIIEEICRLRSGYFDAALTIVSDCVDADIASEAVSLGLNGLISSAETLDVTIAALRLILAGGTYYSRAELMVKSKSSVADVTLAPLRWDDSPVSKDDLAAVPPGGCPEGNSINSHFTTREFQVLDCLQQGLPNKGIANRLNISENTVKVHLRRVMRKLSAKNRTEAALSYTRVHPTANEPGESGLTCLPRPNEMLFQFRKYGP